MHSANKQSLQTSNGNIAIEQDVLLENTSLIPTYGPQFKEVLNQHQLLLYHQKPTELQINLGKLCNLACHHCHVDAGPKRTEIMTWETMQHILSWAEAAEIKSVDLTGGAPELNPHFRQFCDALIKLGISITSRCNITVLFEPQQEDLAQWYADREVRLVCSLPCYTEDNVDAQRGKGVFDKSIKGLQLLNSLGYGIGDDSALTLDLVYNPVGAFLPPEQTKLEQDYRDMLSKNFGISFTKLLAITNIPINRFAHALERDGEIEQYQQLLVSNFNPDNVEGLMCRSLINLDWEGRIFDCDFNQMLEIPFAAGETKYLWDLGIAQVDGASIATNRHCFGCTAGAGSSCGGALS